MNRSRKLINFLPAIRWLMLNDKIQFCGPTKAIVIKRSCHLCLVIFNRKQGLRFHHPTKIRHNNSQRCDKVYRFSNIAMKFWQQSINIKWLSFRVKRVSEPFFCRCGQCVYLSGVLFRRFGENDPSATIHHGAIHPSKSWMSHHLYAATTIGCHIDCYTYFTGTKWYAGQKCWLPNSAG